MRDGDGNIIGVGTASEYQFNPGVSLNLETSDIYPRAALDVDSIDVYFNYQRESAGFSISVDSLSTTA